MMETFRQHVARNVAVYVFELLYFATTVAGNIVFLTPAGSEWPALFINDFSWRSFGISFGAGYWTLLLLPMVAVPPVALLVRSAVRPIAEPLTGWLPEIRWPLYVVLALVLFVYAFHALDAADALQRMTQAEGAFGAVAARYDILASLGMAPQIVMMSLLVFLSIYSIVRSANGDGWFWYISAPIVAISLAVALTLLDMKWPVVIYLLMIAACVFVVSSRFAILKTIAALSLAVVVYLMISVVLLRLVPAPTNNEQAEKTEISKRFAAKKAELSRRFAGDAAQSAILNTPHLLIVALTRMAQSLPYYYATFSEHGQICGTILDRIERRATPCQPSNYVYREMFPQDLFAGTSPAAVNFYGYALDGWAGAIVETVLAGVLFGLFGALWRPAKKKPIIMASYVMGAYAAYFLTQLPIEAAFIYADGLVWWAGLVLLVSILSLPFALARRRYGFT